MRNLSSDLHYWMIAEGYGKVLSRTVLTPKERELCILSALSALSRERQMISHIRGSQNVGASREEIQETIFSLQPVLESPMYDKALELLKRVLNP